jgi:hypothetical protein
VFRSQLDKRRTANLLLSHKKLDYDSSNPSCLRKEGATDKAFFTGVKVEEIEVSGVRVRFPIRYFDSSMIAASFPAPAAKVQEVLPSDKLKPVQVMPGTAAVALAAMEYRHIDGLAPYNEFGVMLPVVYQTADNIPGLPGLYVLHLPVTTEEARWGGVEIYGYPKFIAEISFEDAGEMRRCRIRAEGKDIITLEVKKPVSQPQSWELYTYTVKDGQLLRTLIQQQGQIGTSDVRGGASYTLGDHTIAEELRALGMDKTSVLHQYAPQSQSMLHLSGERLPL